MHILTQNNSGDNPNMAKITIEVDDNILAASIAKAVAGTTGKPSKAKAEPEPEDEDEEDSAYITPEEFLTLCDDAKAASSVKELKEVLLEFEFKTPKAASKADDETLDEMADAVRELVGDGEEEEAEAEAVDVATVKKACQAYSKENGKEALTDLLEEFDIKSAAKLKDLDQDDLDELYAELQS